MMSNLFHNQCLESIFTKLHSIGNLPTGQVLLLALGKVLFLVNECLRTECVTMPKMTEKMQDFLKKQIEVYARKFPDCDVPEVRDFIEEGDQGGFNTGLFPTKQIYRFIHDQLKKFRETGSMKRRKGQGRKPMPQEKVNQIIEKAVHKRFTGSSTKVAAEVGCSKTTVCNKLAENGYKSLPARATQGKMLFHFKTTLLIHCVMYRVRVHRTYLVYITVI